MRRALAARAATVLLTLGLVTTGCTDSGGGGLVPGPPEVDVDTPRLRQLKADAGIADCVPGDAAAVDDGLPDVTLACLGGGPEVDLSALRGPLVVNLWATWCGPCRRELPIYQQFSEKYAARVPVLGIDFNDLQVENALELAKESGVTYPQLADPGSDLIGKGPYRRLGSQGLPVLTLVDADGTVVFSEPREITSLAELEDLVREHLGVVA